MQEYIEMTKCSRWTKSHKEWKININNVNTPQEDSSRQVQAWQTGWIVSANRVQWMPRCTTRSSPSSTSQTCCRSTPLDRTRPQRPQTTLQHSCSVRLPHTQINSTGSSFSHMHTINVLQHHQNSSRLLIIHFHSRDLMLPFHFGPNYITLTLQKQVMPCHL